MRIINSSSPLQQVLFIITPERLIRSAVFSSRCSAVVWEPLNSKVVKCMRHLIRLKCNPLSGKQLIWLIILLYLRTFRGFKILDLNTQTAWRRCAPDFECLVGAEKYFTLDPSLGFPPDFVLMLKGRKKKAELISEPWETDATFSVRLHTQGQILWLQKHSLFWMIYVVFDIDQGEKETQNSYSVE